MKRALVVMVVMGGAACSFPDLVGHAAAPLIDAPDAMSRTIRITRPAGELDGNLVAFRDGEDGAWTALEIQNGA